MKIFFVTTNLNKFEEARDILEKYGVKLKIYREKPVEVQCEKIEEIARLCAIKAYKKLKEPLIVEDAGLFIEHLKGFPGPYSSFTYKKIGCEGILNLLSHVTNRSAYFLSVVVYVDEETLMTFKGKVKGYISQDKRGEKWGFDPIFIPEGSSKTFGEMTAQEKNTYSHRSRAMEKLGRWLRKKEKQVFV